MIETYMFFVSILRRTTLICIGVSFFFKGVRKSSRIAKRLSEEKDASVPETPEVPETPRKSSRLLAKKQPLPAVAEAPLAEKQPHLTVAEAPVVPVPVPVAVKPKQRVVPEKSFFVRSSQRLAKKRTELPQPPAPAAPQQLASFVMPPEVGGQRDFRCHLCNAQFTSIRTTSLHYKNAHANEKWPCDVQGCGKSYSTLEVLLLHKKKRHTGGEHRCATCGKTFHFESYLEEHMQTHGTAIKYACVKTKCLAAYTRRRDLRRHIKQVSNTRRTQHTIIQLYTIIRGIEIPVGDIIPRRTHRPIA